MAKERNNNGFTLIELMVSVSLLAITVVAISGVFVYSIKTQRQILAIEQMTDQTSYAMEFMSRSLRMAVKQGGEGFSCLNNEGDNYQISGNGSSIAFINHLDGDDCQQFFLDGNRLKYRRGVGTASPVTGNLTSPSIDILNLKFSGLGLTQNDNLQPRITVFIEAKENSNAFSKAVTIKTQTSISQRNLDLNY
jgi:prepilin-type N-terminal cleavage/methylation domain-containing protein